MTNADAASVLSAKTPTADQIVLHLDMDCFFAACERLRQPELHSEPLVIGGGFDQNPPRGAVATASYEAREHGVHSAQPITKALRALPRRKDTGTESDTATGVYLESDHQYYSQISAEIMDLTADYADTRRRISIDEAYLDVTNRTDWTDAQEYAADVKTTIKEEVGVTASVGVAPTMSCAKIASDHDKPDGLRVVAPDEVRGFLAPLDIGTIHGVGPVSEQRFKENGVETAGDLASLTTQEVIDRFGSEATTLYDRVRGVDPREVKPLGKPKSISKEKSITPSTSWQRKEALVQTLATRVNQRAESKGTRYRTIGIKVVETPFNLQTRERSLVGPVRDRDILMDNARELLTEFETAEVRKLGVRVSNLDFFDGEQTRIPSWIQDTDATIEIAVSQPSVRQRKLSEYST